MEKTRRTSIRAFIDDSKVKPSKGHIGTAQICDSLSREEIIYYAKNIYNHTIGITEGEKDIARCTHDSFYSDGLCKVCKRSMSDVLKEEVLFNIFIEKKLTKENVGIIKNVLKDWSLSIRFETYLEKNIK